MKSSPASKATRDAKAAYTPLTLKDKVLRVLGPGLITGASDDDPSGIATYSQAGAQFGFSITWTLLFTYPLMAAIQEISGRIGRITGQGIAANLRQHYPNWLLQSIVALVLIANTINIGADLGAMGTQPLCLLAVHGLCHRFICRSMCPPSSFHRLFEVRLGVKVAHGRPVRLFWNGARRQRSMG